MSITIQGHQKISVVQKAFSQAFPFLKLEFFHHKHGVFSGNPKKDRIHNDLFLDHFQKKKRPEELVIKEQMTVAEVESLFQSLFGISAQVFRKSGRSWIETTITDDWTLKRQNDEGIELSQIADS